MDGQRFNVKKIPKGWRLATIHNPKDFYAHTLRVERRAGRYYVVGHARKKGYTTLGVLKAVR